MDTARALASAAGLLAVLLAAFVIGVGRRRAGLRRAQALAPTSFVFRFSMWGDFSSALPHLQSSYLGAQQLGVDLGASVSATIEGLTIWQVNSATELARIPWTGVTHVQSVITTAKAGWSYISYPTVVIQTRNVYGSSLDHPCLSANSRFFWPRTSPLEAERIVRKLGELRNGSAASSEGAGR